MARKGTIDGGWWRRATRVHRGRPPGMRFRASPEPDDDGVDAADGLTVADGGYHGQGGVCGYRGLLTGAGSMPTPAAPARFGRGDTAR